MPAGERFRVLTTLEEWQPIKKILDEIGGQLPMENAAVIFAEFNEQNEVIAFQIVHSGALFAEGLWARDGSAHLRGIWRRMHAWLLERGGKGREFLTMVRGDETGERIGRVAERLGCEKTDWKVYRRTL